MPDFAVVLAYLGTILTAIAAYAIRHVPEKFLFEPLHDLRKVIADVSFNLSFHAPTIHTPMGRTRESSDAAEKVLRKNSSELDTQLHIMPSYMAARIVTLGSLPCKKDVEQAAVLLRGLATHLHETGAKPAASVDEVTRRVERIEKLLKLKPMA
jgi:hypothetical protein